MTDGEIRLNTGVTIACVLWGVALSVLALMWLHADMRLGVIAIVLGQFAAIVTMRQLLVRFSRAMRNAFELGQDSVSPMIRRPR